MRLTPPGLTLLKEGLDGPSRKFGECFVGGCEHRKGPRPLQGLDQSGCTESGGQGLERSRRNGGIDDVFLLRSG